MCQFSVQIKNISSKKYVKCIKKEVKQFSLVYIFNTEFNSINNLFNYFSKNI